MIFMDFLMHIYIYYIVLYHSNICKSIESGSWGPDPWRLEPANQIPGEVDAIKVTSNTTKIHQTQTSVIMSVVMLVFNGNTININ